MDKHESGIIKLDKKKKKKSGIIKNIDKVKDFANENDDGVANEINKFAK